jgi:hypothetical protein
MIWYAQACKLVEDKFIKPGEDICSENLLMPLMVKHGVAFNEDLTWILSEYFQIQNKGVTYERL